MACDKPGVKTMFTGAVTPLGRSVKLTSTIPLKPLSEVANSETCWVVPACIDCVLVVTVRLKSGCGGEKPLLHPTSRMADSRAAAHREWTMYQQASQKQAAGES